VDPGVEEQNGQMRMEVSEDMTRWDPECVLRITSQAIPDQSSLQVETFAE